MSLGAHLEDFALPHQGGRTWEDMHLMAKAARGYSVTDLDEETVVGLFGRVSFLESHIPLES